MNPCKKVTKQLASAMISQFLEKEQKHVRLIYLFNYCVLELREQENMFSTLL